MSALARRAVAFALEYDGTISDCRLEVYLTGFAKSYGGFTGTETEVRTPQTDALYDGYLQQGYSADEALDELFLDGYAEGKAAKAAGE